MDVENGDGMEQDSIPAEKTERKVYLPGKPLDKGEILECDESVYLMRHTCKAGKPFLSLRLCYCSPMPLSLIFKYLLLIIALG